MASDMGFFCADGFGVERNVGLVMRIGFCVSLVPRSGYPKV